MLCAVREAESGGLGGGGGACHLLGWGSFAMWRFSFGKALSLNLCFLETILNLLQPDALSLIALSLYPKETDFS